ncbi:hypothetical protein H112_01993 [Trichophyton rubrum D6]|nr:hypothetical protein H113_01996 [Trichophyton rubrum MR1459]KDB36525.1 hypothetical protein H112_01993 [Trichophyton rubrum D6]
MSYPQRPHLDRALGWSAALADRWGEKTSHHLLSTSSGGKSPWQITTRYACTMRTSGRHSEVGKRRKHLPSAVVSAKAARQGVGMTGRNVEGPIAHDHLPVLPGLEALNPFYKTPRCTPCFGGLGHINCPRAGSTTNEDPREILVSTNIVTEVWKL